ncbi:amidase [Nesterenkonia halobia]|uniref:Amidase n=2 Tax=Nesterenkonia halobia TaxID=37922 RepID=A0ABP6RET4_9MICC
MSAATDGAPRRPAGTGAGGEGLERAPAVEVLGMFARRELAPSEYLDHLVARIDADSDHPRPINAFMEVLGEEARSAAAAADAHYARLGRRGASVPGRRLLGLPVATKEKHGLAGHSHSQGMRAHADAVAARDHPIVRRIRDHGGVIHGRTTSPEFSCATFTHTDLWGTTRNPWDRGLTPGGSSGGAAAALAAGMTPLATASDIAGSTRLPAAFTGVVGYKGPYGAVPGSGVFAADWYRGDGAMARTVADVALLTDVIRGVHPEDHATVPTSSVSVPGGAAALESLRGRRIAYAPTLGDYPVQRGVRRQVDGAVAALEGAGVDVVVVDLPWTTAEIRRTTMAHFGHLLADGMSRLLRGREGTAEDYTRQFIEDARAHAARLSLFETLDREQRMQAELAVAMDGADALLTPVSAVASLPAGSTFLRGLDVHDVADGPDRRVEHYWEAHMTVPFNVANRCPALSMPAGLHAGVPVGLQIVGHPYDEATVFALGAALEAVRPQSAAPPG